MAEGELDINTTTNTEQEQSGAELLGYKEKFAFGIQIDAVNILLGELPDTDAQELRQMLSNLRKAMQLDNPPITQEQAQDLINAVSDVKNILVGAVPPIREELGQAERELNGAEEEANEQLDLQNLNAEQVKDNIQDELRQEFRGQGKDVEREARAAGMVVDGALNDLELSVPDEDDIDDALDEIGAPVGEVTQEQAREAANRLTEDLEDEIDNILNSISQRAVAIANGVEPGINKLEETFSGQVASSNSELINPPTTRKVFLGGDVVTIGSIKETQNHLTNFLESSDFTKFRNSLENLVHRLDPTGVKHTYRRDLLPSDSLEDLLPYITRLVESDPPSTQVLIEILTDRNILDHINNILGANLILHGGPAEGNLRTVVRHLGTFRNVVYAHAENIQTASRAGAVLADVFSGLSESDLIVDLIIELVWEKYCQVISFSLFSQTSA